MKVSNLSGAELDYWVAKAIGDYRELDELDYETNFNVIVCNGGSCQRIYNSVRPYGQGWYSHGRESWRPHEDWEQGGPLIEKYKIVAYPHMKGEQWNATQYREERIICTGSTLLEAAMRAIVSSVYGDKVDG